MLEAIPVFISSSMLALSWALFLRYKAIQIAKVTKSILAKINGLRSIKKSWKLNATSFKMIQITANPIPILNDFFILTIHRDQEFLVGNCIFHVIL